VVLQAAWSSPASPYCVTISIGLVSGDSILFRKLLIHFNEFKERQNCWRISFQLKDVERKDSEIHELKICLCLAGMCS